MQNIKSTYRDKDGDIWEIERQSLPKKKGVYIFWVGECTAKKLSFRGSLKREVIYMIGNQKKI